MTAHAGPPSDERPAAGPAGPSEGAVGSPLTRDDAAPAREGIADAGPAADVAPADEAAADDTPRQPPFPVVGIGGSAGAFEPMRQLLAALPPDTGLALVLVMHLDPTHESALPELLAAGSPIPVLRAEDGQRLRPDHLHVVPANVQLTLGGARIRLEPRPLDASRFAHVDAFFRSLAEAAGPRAIAVILSGSGHDGAAGVREVKAAGGIVLVQDPETAGFDGMPGAALATDAVDMVLGPADLARELTRLARHPLLARRGGEPEPDGYAVHEEHLERIFRRLRAVVGVDFTHYKRATIRRRLQRRMAIHRIDEVGRYLRLLEEDAGEAEALQRDLLIHVTRFFREPEAFEALAALALRPLLERRDEGPLRIWVPGCATGEEPYTIAILVLELLGPGVRRPPVQLFATDVSEAAVQRARAGVYPEAVAADVSPERLQRFFSRIDGHLRVARQVRDLCVFARQDLTRDPPFSRVDLIVCRNVLIYFDPPLQRRVLSLFRYALRPDGFLLLGRAETVGAQEDGFTVVDKQARLYRRRGGGAPLPAHLPVERRGAPPGRPRLRPAPVRAGGPSAAERWLLDRYAPAGVVVDQDLQIVHFRGQTARYLQPPSGEPSFRLLDMAREGLAPALRGALQEAARSGGEVRRAGLCVRDESGAHPVELLVVPLREPGEDDRYLVLFDEAPGPAPAAAVRSAPPGAADDDERIARLEQELAASREYLQAIIQDLEATNEELQSANEEILSSNEELQSTNEELDTAKEELQSTNEELNTVNEELQQRNEELTRVNGDLVNLLASVAIAIVIVDGELRIRRFTPMAERVLNLIPGDVGRPIRHIQPDVDCPDLEGLIRQVIDTVEPQVREVRDRTGRWYSLRVRPYKSLDNRIDGAVLALLDLEGSRRRDRSLAVARVRVRALLEVAHEPLLLLDLELRVVEASPPLLLALGATDEVRGRLLAEVAPGLDLSPLEPLVKGPAARLDGLELGQGPLGAVRVDARRIEDPDGPTLLALAFTAIPA